jgi:hypothetical protein
MEHPDDLAAIAVAALTSDATWFAKSPKTESAEALAGVAQPGESAPTTPDC